MCHNVSLAWAPAIVSAAVATREMSSSAVFSARAIAFSRAVEVAWRCPAADPPSAHASFSGGLLPAPHPSLLRRMAIASPPKRATRASTAFDVPSNLARATTKRPWDGKRGRMLTGTTRSADVCYCCRGSSYCLRSSSLEEPSISPNKSSKQKSR